MNTKTKRLPAKLSDLIEVAVKDLSAVERSRKYKVDMTTWHSPNHVCRVCLAGAVIAKSLDGAIEASRYPGDFPRPVSNRLYALNDIRMNDLAGGLMLIGVSQRGADRIAVRPDLPHIPKYTKAKSPLFKRALRRLAKILREEGL